mgnify:FL=1
MGAFSNFFSKSNSKKVLSFDGGGVRAIAGLVFLHKLEVESGRKISDMFDMFVGVSAGALNALCLGVNQMSAKEIKDYWSTDYIEEITSSNFFWDKASIIQARPKYENTGRIEVLKKIFYDKSMGESPKPVMTLAYDVENRSYVIHSSFETPGISIISACCASSAAPIYFPTFQAEDGGWYIDGGVVSNNPSLLAYTQAKKYFQTDDIKVLSIGTGLNTRKINGKQSASWGGLGWLRHDIMGIMLETGLENDLTQDILGQSYLRINSPIGKINRRLDDSSGPNLEKIHLMGMNWWDEFGDEALKFLDT